MPLQHSDRETAIEAVRKWENLDKNPPLEEVQILRLLDDVKQHSRTIDQATLASLYSALIFYRLKRDFRDGLLIKQLLGELPDSQNEPVVLRKVKQMKAYLNFYEELELLPLKNWDVREADFISVKLKKVKSLFDSVQPVSERLRTEEFFVQAPDDINHYQQSIREELQTLVILLEEAAEKLQNRRNTISVQKLNDKVRQITVLKQEFYKKLPEPFKQTATEEPLEKLDEMVGLKEIKQYIYQYYRYLKYQKKRRSLGFRMTDELGLHMIISGNPGTGKTTIARLLAAVYYQLGLLETGKVVEVNRSHLVGSYVGQSEENTIHYVRQSLGGILFIDEAYSLKREGQSGNDYGQAVIDTLVSSMTSEEYGGRFAVILAGYPEEMRRFLWSNSGLRSRFPEQNQLTLPDFKMEELLQIAGQTALNNDYFFTGKALNKFQDLIERSRVDEFFGNARTVRDLVLKAIFKKGAASWEQSSRNWLDHMRIDTDSLDFAEEQKHNQQSLEQLEQLIGLQQVKEEVKKLSSFVRVQQQRKQNGYPAVPVQLHAVFSGNPGTGKTTVAELYSRILNHCGLLKRGHLIVVSRSDLVAGYVGQTATKTKQKVREALGGVLFIDEAYSLYRGEKDFGKEAIDTLVDEMSRHKENLVVILAGYEREMEQFLGSNPGLESRFKKYFHFENYRAEELVEITKYHLSRYQYKIDEETARYVKKLYQTNKIRGNGRFIVNLVDEAVQYQAWRIMENHQTERVREQKLNKADFQQAWNAVRRKEK